MPPTFFYATCRAGSEPALKRDVAAQFGGKLTPAFMRPQLITWKTVDQHPIDFQLISPFAQVAGKTLGKASGGDEVMALIQSAGVPIQHLQVLAREAPEEGVSEETQARVAALRDELQARLALTTAGLAKPGERVFDVIVGAEGEPLMVGVRTLEKGGVANMAELLELSLPEKAPSRAWLKMEQALRWVGKSSLMAGRTVLELGCAPGGASLSLLDRGAEVYGVDTGAMDAQVLAYRGFHHFKMAAGDLRREMLPPHMDVLVSDMNLEPRVVCQYAEKFAARLRPEGLILTLKINSPQVEAGLPSVIERVRGWAPGPVYVRQLPANRREVTLVSWAESAE